MAMQKDVRTGNGDSELAWRPYERESNRHRGRSSHHNTNFSEVVLPLSSLVKPSSNAVSLVLVVLKPDIIRHESFQRVTIDSGSNELTYSQSGPYGTSNLAASLMSASSPLSAHPQAYSNGQPRQLLRLNTLGSEDTLADGNGPTYSMQKLAHSLRKEHGEMPSGLHVSASPTSSPDSLRGDPGMSTPSSVLLRQRGLSSPVVTSRTPVSDTTYHPWSASTTPDDRLYGPPRLHNRNHYPPPRQYRPYRVQSLRDSDHSVQRMDTSPKSDHYDDEELRTSYRSVFTASSSFVNNSSSTERSSVLTGDSSVGDNATLSPGGLEEKDGGMSVDDAIGMYERGFEDDGAGDGSPEGDANAQSPVSTEQRRRSSEAANHAQQSIGAVERGNAPALQIYQPAEAVQKQPIEGPTRNPRVAPLGPPTERDRYGFRKASQHVTVAQYDAWNLSYIKTLERRRKKWVALLREHNLPTQSPVRFPARSSKVKRFVRKGIPPEWRGAAWFWYADGHAQIQKHPGLYQQLVDQAEKGDMDQNDRELIERDLNRTFPDNIKFKPDPTVSYDTAGNAGGGGADGEGEEETPIVQSLRRVLHAFSMHNPKIGYCQSLNFLVGLLLLFMDEEKAFWMLHIITQTYLPGTHEINLEGANVDLAVLMTCVEESMPAIWGKIIASSDLDHPHSKSVAPSNTTTTTTNNSRATSRKQRRPHLPPISLCTTAWFMSCFIGTLPTETVLRVWDSFFYEGSKTLFRIALAVFKVGQPQILAVHDPMEIFQVVQTLPRGLIDAGALIHACFFDHHRRTSPAKRGRGVRVSQKLIDERRGYWREVFASERRIDAEGHTPSVVAAANDDIAVITESSTTRSDAFPRRMRSGLSVRGRFKRTTP